jgi:arylsulfatase A-like enzyme
VRYAVLLVFVLVSCRAEVRPPPSEPAPDHTPQARASAEELGLQVLHAARGGTVRVQRTIPTPLWSTTPGLKAQRSRAPLQRSDPPSGPVILLMLDTTRADRMSAFGHTRQTTPNLDELATQGLRFSRFYVNGAWTRPSVASIMTSRYRGQHGVEVARAGLPRSEVTLAELFHAAGYETGAVVGNQTVRAANGFHQGFDTFLDPFDELPHDPKAIQMVDAAIDWIEAREDDRWFLWLFLVDPHDPYAPTRPHDLWRDDYRGRTPPVPRAEYKNLPHARQIERMLSLYDGEIHQMDAAIGKLFSHLREQGLWEDATVLVVADHGEAFGENNCFRHPYHLWEPNIHVPMMLKSPALRGGEGMVEDRIFQGIDIAPTLVDLAAIDAEEWEPSGVSAAETLTGPITQGWDHVAYTELNAYGLRRYMVRSGPWKLLRFEPTYLPALEQVWPESHEDLATARHTRRREFLYDVELDPQEETNLVGQHVDIAERMGALLDAFIAGEPEVEQEDIADVPEELLEDLRSLGYVE